MQTGVKHDADVSVRELSPGERKAVALLQDDGRTSFAHMSKVLEVPEPTLRRMVRRLIGERVIAITAVANPRLLGLNAMAWMAVRADWSQTQGLPARMLEISGVDYVATTTGSFQLFAEIGARDTIDLMQRIELMRALPGVRSTETFVYLDLFHQEFRWVGPGLSTPAARRGVGGTRPVGELEQKLILELRRDGRKSFRKIAQDLSVSERQVRRAYAGLTDSGAARVIAVLNPARMGLKSMALLGMRVSPSVSVQRLAAALADEPRVDYLVICTGRFDVLAEVACTGPEELASVVEDRLGAIDGVQDIEVFSYLRLQYRDESVWSAGRVSALERDGGSVA
ncbi:MAG TPA: Lrp/AsnC family transcriptional regulator [Solirubrobacteraceae bacterium]